MPVIRLWTGMQYDHNRITGMYENSLATFSGVIPHEESSTPENVAITCVPHEESSS